MRVATPRDLEALIRDIRLAASVSTRTTVVLQTFYENRPISLLTRLTRPRGPAVHAVPRVETAIRVGLPNGCVGCGSGGAKRWDGPA